MAHFSQSVTTQWRFARRRGSPAPPEAADATEARLRVEVTTLGWFAVRGYFPPLVLLTLVNVDSAVAGRMTWRERTKCLSNQKANIFCHLTFHFELTRFSEVGGLMIGRCPPNSLTRKPGVDFLPPTFTAVQTSELCPTASGHRLCDRSHQTERSFSQQCSFSHISFLRQKHAGAPTPGWQHNGNNLLE